MATTAFSSKVIWGASRPRISLVGGDVFQKLSGTWTWAEGSTTVLIDEDITDNVLAGDRIKAFVDGKYWTIDTISYADATGITTISLTSAYDESPNLVTNGDFASWTTDDPDGWTVENEAGADIVTEDTERCNIVDTTGGNNIGISQSILTAGRQYKAVLDVDTVTSGRIVVGIGNRHKAFNLTGNDQEWIATAANATFRIRSHTNGASDVIFDDVSVIRYSTEAFVSRNSNIILPHTSDTVFDFIPERNDGGSPFITLESGEVVSRHDGFRARVTLSWKRMDRFDFKKIVQAWNWLSIGQVMLIPHEDVSMQFDVFPEGTLSPRSVGDLFDGHAYSVTFVSRRLIKDIPTAEAVGGAHPIVF